MQSRPISLASLVVALALVAACSKSGGPPQQDAHETAPDVSPSVTPGVAFNFNYEFNLADERISATEETQASECEKLGLARCRITGMSYSVDQNEQVTAELDLRLDPLIARQFGKSAQQSVESNDGKLVRLEIGSTDEGAAIDQAGKRKTDSTSQIAQLQEELAKTRQGSSARANILTQIQALTQQASEETHAIEASQAMLASTPMAFHYYGRGGVPGFRGNPLREAWQTFVTTVVWLIGMLLQTLAVLIPLTILIGLLIALWRSRAIRVIRSWIGGPKEAEA